VADRFAVSGAQRVVDLATGELVVLTITSAGGPHDQRRWAVRCDAFLKLQHHSMATLVDYGEIGETQRFEAVRDALRRAVASPPSPTPRPPPRRTRPRLRWRTHRRRH